MQSTNIEELLDIASINREKRKSIKITITELGELKLDVPIDMSLNKIKELLAPKVSWMQKKLTQNKGSMVKNQYMLSYNQTLICGEKYDILPANCTKIVQKDKCLYVPKKFYEKNTQIKNIRKWYKNFAKEIIEIRLNQLKNATKISYKTLKICDTKAKWGSCDSSRNIKINWRVVMLPPNTIDMVLLHELVHIIEFNHSKKFYDILQKFMPSFKSERKVLKEYNFLLKLYRD